MIIYGGREKARLAKNLPDPDGTDDAYHKLRDKLTEYFAPRKNKHYARYIFLKMRPLENETTVSYAARLREMERDCDFQNEGDTILEHIIQTTENKSLVKKQLITDGH